MAHGGRRGEADAQPKNYRESVMLIAAATLEN